MGTKYAAKVQTLIGLALLAIAVLGFVVSLIVSLPRQDDIAARAQPLEELPRDFFSDNPTTSAVRDLKIPGGVPVDLDANNLGRPNVFESY
jgi:hypothetical protein